MHFDTILRDATLPDGSRINIVYGGDKKLATLLRETKELFPLAKAISVLSECPVGLIGDDINSVAKTMSKELDLPVFPCKRLCPPQI